MGDTLHVAIAHLLLSGTSLWTLSVPPRHRACSYYGTFGNVLFYGVAGALYYGIPSLKCNDAMRLLFVRSCQATRCLALPCLATHLHLDEDPNNDLAYLHVASGAIIFLLFVLDRPNSHLTDAVLLGNILSTCYTSFKHENNWGFCAAACSLAANFLLRGLRGNPDFPVEVLHPITYCFFQYSALRSLTPRIAVAV